MQLYSPFQRHQRSTFASSYLVHTTQDSSRPSHSRNGGQRLGWFSISMVKNFMPSLLALVPLKKVISSSTHEYWLLAASLLWLLMRYPWYSFVQSEGHVSKPGIIKVDVRPLTWHNAHGTFVSCKSLSVWIDPVSYSAPYRRPVLWNPGWYSRYSNFLLDGAGKQMGPTPPPAWVKKVPAAYPK